MIKYSCLAYYRLQIRLRNLNNLLICHLDKILGAKVLKQTTNQNQQEIPNPVIKCPWLC